MGAAGSVPQQVWSAARAGKAAHIARLLNQDSRPDDAGVVPMHELLAQVFAYTAEDGTNALMTACQHGMVDAVNELLQQGAPPNVRHRQTGDSPLHFAVLSSGSAWGAKEQSKQRCSIVSTLLTAGCDPTIRNSQGFTCMDVARMKGSSRVPVLRLMEGQLSAWQGEVWVHQPGVLSGLVSDNLRPRPTRLEEEGRMTGMLRAALESTAELTSQIDPGRWLNRWCVVLAVEPMRQPSGATTSAPILECRCYKSMNDAMSAETIPLHGVGAAALA